MTISIKTRDKTLAVNNIKYWLNLISEYEKIKHKHSTRYKFVTDFYKAHGLNRQNFIKYYNRYKIHQDTNALLPQTRGPRYKTKRTPGFIEEKVIALRKKGLSRYDIYSILQDELKSNVPAPSTIYLLCKKNNLNRLKPKMKRAKQKIIKTIAGELGHIDCHYLPKGTVADGKRYYLVAIIDSCTRIAWADAVTNIKALTVMFSALKSLNMIKARYSIEFTEMLSDNGAEFGAGPNANNKDTHPFEMMLKELGIKHRYTRPYRPQTNGKVERLWKTINEDLLDNVVFDNLEHLKDELQQYLLYYNEIRPHQAMNGNTPEKTLQSCHRNT